MCNWIDWLFTNSHSAGSTQTCERVYVWNQLQAIMCRMHRLLFSQCSQHKNGIRSRPLFLHCPYFERPHSDVLFRLSESEFCLWIHTRSCSPNIFVLNISAPRILSKSSSGSSCANLNLLTLERPCAIPAPCSASRDFNLRLYLPLICKPVFRLTLATLPA